MPSPFPGMDPWLERPALFPDLHDELISCLRTVLNRSLPAGYAALGSSLVWVDPTHHREPDLSVLGPLDRRDGEAATELFSEAGMVAVAAEPIAEPWSEPLLEIRTVEDERLVTAIEVLSPSNKRAGDDGRTAYLQKQGEFRRSGVHLVEIDLLRGGTHSTAIPANQLRQILPGYDYHVCVTVIGDPIRFEVKPFRLADRLPAIVIPLDPGVAPVVVDLQPVLDRAYDSGRYSQFAKYATKQPTPKLTRDQQAWAEGLLKTHGELE